MVTMNKKINESFDRILISVGRRPNTEGIGLENTNVKLDDKGFVKVDLKRQTADPVILAIGDITGEPMLAHKASHEARVAVEGLSGEDISFADRIIPAVVFTDPEIAWCGLTESEAKKNNISVEVARFPWGASGRAHRAQPGGATRRRFRYRSSRRAYPMRSPEAYLSSTRWQ